MIRKLESVFRLANDERQALENLPMQLAVIKDHQYIVREGDRPSRSCLILSGFTATCKFTAGGKRQIVCFNIPVDIPDLQSLHLKAPEISIGTITTCRVGFVAHEVLRDLCKHYPRIAPAFWRETLLEGPSSGNGWPMSDAARPTIGWPTSCASCWCA